MNRKYICIILSFAFLFSPIYAHAGDSSAKKEMIKAGTATVIGAAAVYGAVAATGMTAAGMVGSGAGIGAAAGPVGAAAGAVIGIACYGIYRIFK